MSKRRGRLERRAVYAVIRVDSNLSDVALIQDQVTVTEVLPTLDQAEKEAGRLNALAIREEKSARYFVQATRFFPDGVDLTPP